ncbi:hypothetical protein [Pseudonocardia asaccharolytica]|uniref:Nitroreductase n=1 Tax=Pseudonocardia asaccharolytica DSM 44247 = NBRC 16224 TaxID=1123024 RepID=A0A511CVL3_9PSEU|nr:hypothetical protein [Pseudonocardia asaccharolytica]GEL16591.1 hypothetical protein PA7_04280 [Pseudonocardia asaccharolytica DSM 44247 = NBRC 16224]
MTTTQAISPATRPWRAARVTAPVARVLAGRRFFPLWAVVHHRGRKTGRALSVPVAVRARADTFVITLPGGPRTNWAQNVLAAGDCVVRWKGVDHLVTQPELIGTADAKPYFGPVTWAVVQRVIRPDTFLRLHR